MTSSRNSDFIATKNFTSQNKNIQRFLDDLRNLLDEHNAKLYINQCELYLDSEGYVGFIEDNFLTVDLILEGGEVIASSKADEED